MLQKESPDPGHVVVFRTRLRNYGAHTGASSEWLKTIVAVLVGGADGAQGVVGGDDFFKGRLHVMKQWFHAPSRNLRKAVA